MIWNQGNRGCYVHTQAVARGNGAAHHRCWVFSKCSTYGKVFDGCMKADHGEESHAEWVGLSR